ncbi:MAG: helix-turn-helix transcriptional regulator [Armatimonadetes bacterium]|nr:helix-turn-helix transcriptional regulator [Armatimonadota bacterium]
MPDRPQVQITCAHSLTIGKLCELFEKQGFGVNIGPTSNGHQDKIDVHILVGDLLSQREIAVLQCSADHATAIEIGQQLGLSPGTVRRYLDSVRKKIGVPTTVQAVVWALRHGLIG